jgi:hypothetical protein
MDVNDSSAAAVSALNSSVWPTAADVADYAYKSLGTLWIGAATPSSDLEERIVYKFGEGENYAYGEISLLSMPTESIYNDMGEKRNEEGALDFYLEIVYRLNDRDADWDKIYNTSMRVRYLLDYGWRAQRTRYGNVVSPYINVPSPLKTDKGLKDPGIRCEWLGYITPPNAIEAAERYLISYTVIVPK